MKNTFIIIASIVIIASCAFFCYMIQQQQVRQKELDKRNADNLQQQKEINELIKEKLNNNELSLINIRKNKSTKKNKNVDESKKS